MAISLGGVQFSISLKTGRTASQIDRVTQSLVALNAATNQTAPNLQQIQNSLGGFAGTAGQAGSSATVAASGIDALTNGIAALGSSIAASKLSNLITDSTLLAGRVENLGTIVENVGRTASYSASEVALFEANIKNLGITTQASREIMARFAQNNLDLTDAVKLARVAQDAAVIAGTNSSEAAEKMAVAVFRLDTRMLRNQGILVNLRQEYQRFGLATGRVETSLTATEKQQITLNAVFRQGVRIAGNYEKSLQDVYKQYTSMSRFTEEASRTLGEQFLPAFSQLIAVQTTFLKGYQATSPGFKGFTASILATTTAFFGLATVMATVRSAFAAYNIIQASSASLTAVTTARVVGFSAAANVAAVSTTRLAGAVGVLRGGFAALFSLPGLVGISAIIGAYIYVTSRARNVAKEFEEAVGRGAVAAAKYVNVRSSVEALEQFAEKEKLTADEGLAMRMEMTQVIALLPEYRTELEQASDSAERFVSVLRDKFPQGFQVFSDFLKNSQNDLVEVRKKIAEAESRNEALQGAYKDVGPEKARLRRQIDDLKKLEAEKLSVVEQSVDAQREYEIRKLREVGELQETGVQLAERLQSRLTDAAFKNLKDKSTLAIRDMLDQQRALTSVVYSESQLLNLQKLELEKIDSQSKGPEETEGSFEARKNSQRAVLMDELEGFRKSRERIQQAFASSTEIAVTALAEEEKQIAAVNREIRLLDKGFSEDLVKAQLKAEEQMILFNNEIEHQAQAVGQLRKEVALFDKANKVPGVEPARVASNKAEIDRRLEQIKIVERAMRATQSRQIVEARRIQREITQIQKEETDERIELVEKEADKNIEAARKVIEDREKATESTSSFINDMRASLKDFYELPGFKEIYDVVTSFADATKQAGSEEQIAEIANLFDMAVGQKLTELAGQGTPLPIIERLAAEANQMRSVLSNASSQRLETIRQEDAAFQVNVEQLDYLRGIYDLLKGGSSSAPQSQYQVAGTRNGVWAIESLRSASRPGAPQIPFGVSEDFLQQQAGPLGNRDSRSSALDQFANMNFGNPFAAGVGETLNKTAGQAGMTTTLLSDMAEQLDVTMNEIATEFQSQNSILTSVTNVLRVVSDKFRAKEREGIDALNGRGL